jgi:hypothetical protein
MALMLKEDKQKKLTPTIVGASRINEEDISCLGYHMSSILNTKLTVQTETHTNSINYGIDIKCRRLHMNQLRDVHSEADN